MRLLLLLSLCLASAACTDDAEAAAADRASVLDGLKAADLDVRDLAAIDTSAYGAVSCDRGVVERLQLTLCAFEDESAAEKSAVPMEELLASEALTVVSHARGRVVVTVADVDSVDANGKAMVRVVSALQSPKGD